MDKSSLWIVGSLIVVLLLAIGAAVSFYVKIYIPVRDVIQPLEYETDDTTSGLGLQQDGGVKGVEVEPEMTPNKEFAIIERKENCEQILISPYANLGTREEQYYDETNKSYATRNTVIFGPLYQTECKQTGVIELKASDKTTVLDAEKYGRLTIIEPEITQFKAVFEDKLGSNRDGKCASDGSECCITVTLQDKTPKYEIAGCTKKQLAAMEKWWDK